MNTKLRILTLTVTLGADASNALAQSGGHFTLTRSTLDGGGGASAGGAYSLNATVGQPDAGSASGGVFTFAGGFWPDTAEAAPSLRISCSGGSVVISWPASASGFKLQQRPAPESGTWTDVTAPVLTFGDEKLVVLSPTEPVRFYRLLKP